MDAQPLYPWIALSLTVLLDLAVLVRGSVLIRACEEKDGYLTLTGVWMTAFWLTVLTLAYSPPEGLVWAVMLLLGASGAMAAAVIIRASR